MPLIVNECHPPSRAQHAWPFGSLAKLPLPPVVLERVVPLYVKYPSYHLNATRVMNIVKRDCSYDASIIHSDCVFF